LLFFKNRQQEIIMPAESIEYEAFESKTVPGEWRAEACGIDDDGSCYVTIFTGPGAQQRAEEYAAWKNVVRHAEAIA
jgi:hypothetical protein